MANLAPLTSLARQSTSPNVVVPVQYIGNRERLTQSSTETCDPLVMVAFAKESLCFVRCLLTKIRASKEVSFLADTIRKRALTAPVNLSARVSYGDQVFR